MAMLKCHSPNWASTSRAHPEVLAPHIGEHGAKWCLGEEGCALAAAHVPRADGDSSSPRP
jgi:hypothetical protein